MHFKKILRTYHILFKFWLGIWNNRSLCINRGSIRLFPTVNLRFAGYARTTKSNERMSKCNERISKSDWEFFHGLHNKVGLVLLCTVKNAIVSATYPSESHEYSQLWTWIVMKSHEFSYSKYCGNPESISSLDIVPSVCEALHRYELFYYFESWFHNSTFPITRLGKKS